MQLQDSFRLLIFAATLMSASASAQSPEVGLTPAERLEQLDETYTTNLRKYHAPIIQEYLASLEKFKQTMAQRGYADRIADVLSEIERINKINANTGLLPYDSRQPSPRETAPDSKSLAKFGKNTGQAAIILTAASAKRFTPELAKLPDKPDGRAVPVGAAEWQIDKIPAGDYRISVLYSCAGKPSDSAVITASLGQASVPYVMSAANVTGGINEFRIVRLGNIHLEKELTGVSLVLRNSDPASAAMWVRQAIITRLSHSEK